MPASALQEIEKGQRFSFGKNWASFLKTLDDSRIDIATESLRQLLSVDTLNGKTFLDIGCGSGLFSLAARRLEAVVHSFDFDPQSVECTQELRRRYFPDEKQWQVEQGSALDANYLKSLGRFDVVYSWGVLHHTGDMWQAIRLASSAVADQGTLAIALYNDQGIRSRLWKKVKQIYCSGSLGRALILAIFLPYFTLRTLALCVIRGRNEFAAYRRNRGMSIVHDWIDWLGGLPFEVATPEAVEEFLKEQGFQLKNIRRTKRLGCNEFVFVRSAPLAE